MQVADLKMLKEEGHKFESRYIDNLVGESNALKRAFNLCFSYVNQLPKLFCT